MRSPIHWLAMAAVCILTLACSGGEDTGGNASETGTGAAAVDDTTEVQLAALGGSGLSGEVRLMTAGALTRVNVEVAGAQGAGVHQGHIHQGTCENLGAVVAPLNPLATNDQGQGQVASTVEIAKLDMMDGQHVISYHAPGGNPGPAVACAALPEANLRTTP